MLQYPDIDPVALELGPLTIHWYGLTYLFAFLVGWWLAKLRARRPGSGWDPDEIGDAVFYIVIGVIVGGKLGSLLFYQTGQLIADPIATLNPFGGGGGWRGMSFHGGFVGVLIAFWFYGRKTGRTFFQVSDFFTPAFPIGLGAGRIGNFINGELYGRVTDVPWGMVFPHAGPEPRHPNQLYQFFCEGVLLFALIWWFSSKPRPRMTVSGLFVLAYGVYRFGIEFVRQPDAHLGFVAAGWLTMGQLLSLPMIVAGAAMMAIGFRRGIYDGGTDPEEGGRPGGGTDAGNPEAGAPSAGSSRADGPNTGSSGADSPNASASSKQARGNKPRKARRA